MLTFSKREQILTILLLAYFWECSEHYLEAASAPPIMAWFAGVEFWANRLISDVALVLAGYFAWRKFGWCYFPRIFSIVWLTFNVLIWSDCMFLQRAFPEEIDFFWGDKTNHFFDFWSVEHFVSGITISGLIFAKEVKT